MIDQSIVVSFTRPYPTFEHPPARFQLTLWKSLSKMGNRNTYLPYQQPLCNRLHRRSALRALLRIQLTIRHLSMKSNTKDRFQTQTFSMGTDLLQSAQDFASE